MRVEMKALRTVYVPESVVPSPSLPSKPSALKDETWISLLLDDLGSSSDSVIPVCKDYRHHRNVNQNSPFI